MPNCTLNEVCDALSSSSVTREEIGDIKKKIEELVSNFPDSNTKLRLAVNISHDVTLALWYTELVKYDIEVVLCIIRMLAVDNEGKLGTYTLNVVRDGVDKDKIYQRITRDEMFCSPQLKNLLGQILQN